MGYYECGIVPGTSGVAAKLEKRLRISRQAMRVDSYASAGEKHRAPCPINVAVMVVDQTQPPHM